MNIIIARVVAVIIIIIIIVIIITYGAITFQSHYKGKLHRNSMLSQFMFI